MFFCVIPLFFTLNDHSFLHIEFNNSIPDRLHAIETILIKTQVGSPLVMGDCRHQFIRILYEVIQSEFGNSMSPAGDRQHSIMTLVIEVKKIISGVSDH